MTENTIVLEGVSRWYGPVIGLNEVSICMGAGVTGLLGPNGAGKSTLLRLVTGQIAASLGNVRVFGEPAFQNANVLARVGCCPDIERFQDGWTGYDFVFSMAWLSGLSRADARARTQEALREVDLADVSARKIGGYSKGMRQRIKLAQAIVHDPDVLILDEPLTGMDPVSRRRTADLVRRFADSGRCVVISSHVLHEVEAMTDQVVLMHHGRVLAEGQIHEIRALLKGHPHRVTVLVERPQEVAAALLRRVSVDGLRIHGDELTIDTAAPSSLFAALQDLVLDEGLGIRRMYTRDDSLEAVFDYLIR